MVAKFLVRPSSLPFAVITSTTTHLFLFPKRSLPRLAIISILSTASTPTIGSTLSPKCFLYGPSLSKGQNPFQYVSLQQFDARFLNGDKEDHAENDEMNFDDAFVLDKERFIRVFDIAALRVPAKHCFALESRLRGHLLNWPRIQNIARVPGDEVEEEIVSLLGDTGNGEEAEEIDSLNRRVYGSAEVDGEEQIPVLYREKLAKEFNSRGFFKFRNLAKISRPPKRRRKKSKGEGDEKIRRRNGKDEFAMVKVVEENDEGEDWKGLLGDEFKGRRKWSGSTRLLLLDERYADKRVEDLPQAIKVAILHCFEFL